MSRVLITREVSTRIQDTIRQAKRSSLGLVQLEHQARREVMYCAQRAIHHQGERNVIHFRAAGMKLTAQRHPTAGHWSVVSGED